MALRETIAVMAKAPRLGDVKTRLHAALGLDGATALYESLLRDTFDLVSDLRRERPGVRVVLSFAPADGLDELERLSLGHDAAIAQRGDDLGERVTNCFRDALADGADAVALVGADAPTLPVERLAEAFAALAGGADLALGPAEDGGYYLVGARGLHESLFRNMAWSTATVFAETRARARALGLAVHELAPWYDVDEAADLERLQRDLRGARGRCARTRAFFESRRARYGDLR